MRFSLRLKLFLVLLTVTAVAVAGTWLFMDRAFESGFVRLVEARQRVRVDAVIQALAREYEEAGGWDRLAGNPGRWVEVLLEARGTEGRPPRWARRLRREPDHDWPPEGHDRRRGAEGHPGRTPLEFRMMLLDADRRVLFGRAAQAHALALSPILVAKSTVGYLGVLPGPALNEVADIAFVTEQKRQFFVIAGVMVLVTAALALPLAGGMTRRIRRIATGARSLAAGDYDSRVTPGALDELGSLAVDFNELAGALEAARRSRRQWVADVSHELRTPLAVLRAELEAMQDGVRDLDARSVEVLHGEVMRLGRLVDNLYDLSLADLGALSYRKEEVDPLDVLHTELEGLSPEFSARGLHVEWDRSKVPGVGINADPDRLSQLWTNLLTNTLRYTDVDGRLDIEAFLEGTDLVVDLKDSAPGVPAEHLEHVFERFHRVEGSRSREYGGAGLGLAICKSIVAAHGGSVEARQSPLGGLWIPGEAPCAQRCWRIMSSETILLVEDEPRLADVLSRYLVREGFAVHVIPDGNQVIPWLREHEPCLVILDLMLPGRDGLDIMRELRSFSVTPVIMTTARVEEIDRLLGLELGADDYICKPYSPREVVARVRAVLRRVRSTESGAEAASGDPNLHMDTGSLRVRGPEGEVQLTAVEFHLLECLYRRPGRIFSRGELMDRIYADGRVVSDRTIDSHVKKLRRKLADVVAGRELVHSVYGVGYRYEPDPR